MVQRHRGLVTLTLSLLAAPLTAAAQPVGKTPRIGVLVPGPPAGPWVDAFRQGLRALGYVEDQTIALEIRWDEGDPGRWPDLAAELVVRNVDILVAGSGSAAQATKRTTTTMPIVMLVGVDPVAQGLVTSLTHPGGNITGLTVTTTAMTQKRLELLKEAGPSLSRVAVLWGGSQPVSRPAAGAASPWGRSPRAGGAVGAAGGAWGRRP